MPAVLNAANEVAVQAFLDNRIPFNGISRLVNQAMEEHTLDPGAELEAFLKADAWARRRTEEKIPNLQ
jgi:1-deoxy-D-xylulose-5-phosphate reductoisomerase